MESHLKLPLTVAGGEIPSCGRNTKKKNKIEEASPCGDGVWTTVCSKRHQSGLECSMDLCCYVTFAKIMLCPHYLFLFALLLSASPSSFEIGEHPPSPLIAGLSFASQARLKRKSLPHV
ncbi:hypothetical protein OPV22_033298 [Ensete ventricosum]|uniref:Uncharacterized protein n=1 Tax=Ensete ventricosum TaxID=4639 RepID=A0AAV8PXU7_ENSVE|nr:hypothetical protein OPV22_033298 [Ensete ventricosum]